MNKYLTVAQYAKLFSKDPGNIRRMLINGTIPGEKIGNQWLIPEDTQYPEDARIKNGNYKNWRNKVKLNSRYPELLKKLNSMCADIAKINSDISEVILYGSYARGQENDESDIDLAIVLNKKQSETDYNKMTNVVVDYELDLGVTLSVITIERHEFVEWKTTLPFYKNIEKEGIVLWKSA